MDKTLIKAAGITAIIFGILYSITIIGAIIGVPLIIGGSNFVDYSKLDDEKIKEKKDTMLGWSIFFTLTAFIPGVLGLIGYVSLFENVNIVSKKQAFKDKIVELDEMKKDGLLTESEYKKRKEKILEED